MKTHDKKNAATIKDIAKMAGVDASTVSRVLNSKGYIKKETRLKVLESADILKYIPNPAARTLKTSKTKQIMLSIPDMNEFYFKMISVVQEIAKKNKYSLLLNFSDADEKEEIKILRNLRENFIDGLIMISINVTKNLIREISEIGHPIVLSGICNNYLSMDEQSFDYVGVDTHKGMYIATRHLIEQGCRKIGYVGLQLNTQPGNERYGGFCQAMKDYDLEIDAKSIDTSGYSFEVGYKAAMDFIENGEMPMGICAATDLLALGIYKAFEHKKIRVGQDVLIIGMNNTASAILVKPEMSSVEIAQSDIGRTAAEIIFRRFKGSEEPFQNIIFQPRLFARQSSLKKI